MHSNTPCRFPHPSPHVRSPQYSQLLLLRYLFSSLLLVLFPHTVEPPSGIKILTGFSFYQSGAFLINTLILKSPDHGFNFRLEYSWFPTPWGQYILWPKEP